MLTKGVTIVTKFCFLVDNTGNKTHFLTRRLFVDLTTKNNQHLIIDSAYHVATVEVFLVITILRSNANLIDMENTSGSGLGDLTK